VSLRQYIPKFRRFVVPSLSGSSSSRSSRTGWSLFIALYLRYIVEHKPIPVAARPKAWFCGRSLAGIVGSIPAGGVDVCLL
jgi:hypothetical protein